MYLVRCQQKELFIAGTFEKIGFLFINFLKVYFSNPLVICDFFFHQNGMKLGKGFC